MRILITGAAGNLGSLLARYLLDNSDHFLNLMVHKRPCPPGLTDPKRARVYDCDLAIPPTLSEPCANSDVVVHFAGVLFEPEPERFLPTTNVSYVRNIVGAAIAGGVKRFILISFPHVEGPTSRESPCTDRVDKTPISIHAKTRLDAERYLFERAAASGLRAISLRAGMIYGRDVLMIAFAKKLASMHLLGVWRKPTPVHLLSIADFNACCKTAIENPDANGIYPLGDDNPTTLQEFLDAACRHWGFRRPWRVPIWSVYLVAWLCERLAALFGTRTPFTSDFITIGRIPYYCDTRRMRADLLPQLRHPSFYTYDL